MKFRIEKSSFSGKIYQISAYTVLTIFFVVVKDVKTFVEKNSPDILWLSDLVLTTYLSKKVRMESLMNTGDVFPSDNEVLSYLWYQHWIWYERRRYVIDKWVKKQQQLIFFIITARNRCIKTRNWLQPLVVITMLSWNEVRN